MHLRCRGRNASDLTEEYFEMGYTAKAGFPITPGKDYRAYGMCIFRGALLFLVESNNDVPDWCPAVLFDVVKHEIPSGWCFSLNSGERSAIWGYKELVLDSDYFDRLSEHEDAALAVYRAHKNEEDSDQ